MRIQVRGGMARVRESLLPRARGGLIGGLLFGILWALGGAASAALLGYPGHLIALVSVSNLLTGIGLGLAVGLVLGIGAGLEKPIKIDESVLPSDLLNTNRVTVLTEVLMAGVVIGTGYGIIIGYLFGTASGLALGLAAALVTGLGVATLTAWGRWAVLARIWLPLTGRLPWALSAFLDDAYQRNVLRQAGAVYQFRHARLRDRLAEAFQERPSHHSG